MPSTRDATQAVFDAFFNSACDAVIYDETLLQGELIHRRQVTQEYDPQYERVQKAGVVGESLKWDPCTLRPPSKPVTRVQLLSLSLSLSLG